MRAKACFPLVFGIDCSGIDRQSRSRLARIAVIFRGGGSQNEHQADYAQSGTCSTPAPSPSARRTGITPELIFLPFSASLPMKPIRVIPTPSATRVRAPPESVAICKPVDRVDDERRRLTASLLAAISYRIATAGGVCLARRRVFGATTEGESVSPDNT